MTHLLSVLLARKSIFKSIKIYLYVSSYFIGISDAGSVMSTVTKPEELLPQKKVKIQTPPPDHFFKKKKIKNDEDMNVLKDIADTIRTMTATLSSTSASTSSKQRMSQDSQRPAEMSTQKLKHFFKF